MKEAFNEKAMVRLQHNVADWKEKWRDLGDRSQPLYISNDVWKGIKAYWNLPKSVRKSLKCSASRMTRYAQGNLPIPHTSGQIPHAGKALQIVSLLLFFNFKK